MKRRVLVTAILAASCASWLTPSAAEAAQREVFSAANFAAAQERDARILVDISASWCPTCKAQKPIVDRLAAEPANKDLLILSVDFDSQKPVVREFGARMQSTLIAFRGKSETARSVGDTNPRTIAALVDSNRAK